MKEKNDSEEGTQALSAAGQKGELNSRAGRPAWELLDRRLQPWMPSETLAPHLLLLDTLSSGCQNMILDTSCLPLDSSICKKNFTHLVFPDQMNKHTKKE